MLTDDFRSETYTVPVENIDANGHSFYADEEAARKNGVEFRVLWEEGKVTMSNSMELNLRCWRCGDSLRYVHDEQTNSIKVSAVRCEYPDGTFESRIEHPYEHPCEASDDMETVVRLSVPSGRMIVDDDLRGIYRADDSDLSFNHARGRDTYVKRMAELGCAFGSVGNTDPRVYLRPDGTYAIATVPRSAKKGKLQAGAGWVEQAHIETNLWAYSIADYEDYLAKGGTPVETSGYGLRSVIDVEPGVYEFRLYTARADFDADGSPGEMVVFADFHRVDED